MGPLSRDLEDEEEPALQRARGALSDEESAPAKDPRWENSMAQSVNRKKGTGLEPQVMVRLQVFI